MITSSGLIFWVRNFFLFESKRIRNMSSILLSQANKIKCKAMNLFYPLSYSIIEKSAGHLKLCLSGWRLF